MRPEISYTTLIFGWVFVITLGLMAFTLLKKLSELEEVKNETKSL